jgi:Protein kinase domain/Ankyrin repeats (3 copies)
LYSRLQNVWKIADFGVTSAVSVSRPTVATVLRRGTSGFLAPEVLSEEPNYSTKVDIWALACILYQLCSTKPLFSNDFAVFGFENSKLDLSNANIPDVSRTHVFACLQEMLMRDPHSRPSASSLKSLFNLYYVISDPIFSEIPIASLSYSDWKGLVSNIPGEPEDVIKLVVDWILSKDGKAAGAAEPLLKAPVEKLPKSIDLYDGLAELHEEKGYLSAAITMRKQIIIISPADKKRQTEKVDGLKQRNDASRNDTSQLLLVAVEAGWMWRVRSLLDNGADANAQGGFYGNVLQAAVYRRSEPLVSLLLEKGADVNAQGGYYGNALQVAAARRDEAITSLLLEKGANVNAQGGHLGNALQAAALFGDEAIVSLLLEKGADVNAQGGLYGNALQAAADSGSKANVLLLLEKGADINAQGGRRGNALQAAELRGYEAIVSLLLEKGAIRGDG